VRVVNLFLSLAEVEAAHQPDVPPVAFAQDLAEQIAAGR